MRMPEMKFEIVSFSANPSANPVKPNLATSADTLIPIVPSAVTDAKMMTVILLVRANIATRWSSMFNRSVTPSMTFLDVLART